MKDNKNKSFNKTWRSTRKQDSERVSIDGRTVGEIVRSISPDNANAEDFLESFCHKYSNLNNTLAAGVVDRMMADIEKREKKQIELTKAEKAFKKMHQKPIDTSEKDMCHDRLYSDAFFRAHKLTGMMKDKETEESKHLKQEYRTASKKRIDQFIEKVNNEILENKQTLEQKRRIKELKEEIEYQKVKNRSMSRGKLSKEKEKELVSKMSDYEKKKWMNREHKVRQKEMQAEKELEGYFKPQVSKSSKRLALKKRTKKGPIVTGGVAVRTTTNKEDSVDEKAHNSIFDRLYNESKKKNNKSQNQTECSVPETNVLTNKANRTASKSNKRTRTNPSFQIQHNASPLDSIDFQYPPSPVIDPDKTRLIVNKYLYDSNQIQNNMKDLRNTGQNYTSNGANSP